MSASHSPGRIAIVGEGAVTSLGLYPEAIAAAVAGGISRIRTVETMRHARSGDAIQLALSRRMPIHLPLAQRLRWMGEKAALQALAPLRAVVDRPQVCILIAMPDKRNGSLSGEASGKAGRELMLSLPVEPIRGISGVYSVGHDGGMRALAKAREILLTGAADICLVGGVDSYCDADALESLGKANRLKGEEAPAGFIPGEGAAFVLVVRAETAGRLGIAPLAYLTDVALVEEPNPWHSGRATQGFGLTNAIAAVFDGQPPSVIADVTYCDANGEHWRPDEWSFAYLRTADRHADPLDIRHPADCWGDVGASSAVLLSVISLVDHRRGRVRGPRILVWCASDMGSTRGAILLEAGSA